MCNVKAVGATALLRLSSATQEEYQRDSGVWVAPDKSKRVEDAAQSGATVVSVGNALNLPIKAGDMVVIDYRVVSDATKDERGNTTYVHRIDFPDEELWSAEYKHLIAVKKDGMWQALGEHVIMEAMTEPHPAAANSSLILPDIQLKGKGKLVSGIEELNAGTTIVFDSRMAATYNFPDKKDYLVVYLPYIYGHE